MGPRPQSVRLDPGGTVRADEVVLPLPAAREAGTQALAVEGGTDGSSLTTLSVSAAPLSDLDRANAATLTFPARDVRRLQVRVTANADWNAAQLSALEVCGEDGGGGPGQPPADGTDPARAANRSRRPPRFTPSWQPTPTTGASTPTGVGRSSRHPDERRRHRIGGRRRADRAPLHLRDQPTGVHTPIAPSGGPAPHARVRDRHPYGPLP